MSLDLEVITDEIVKSSKRLDAYRGRHYGAVVGDLFIGYGYFTNTFFAIYFTALSFEKQKH